MLSFPAAIKVYLCTVPCDMRRSFDGLSIFKANRLLQEYGYEFCRPPYQMVPLLHGRIGH